MAERERLVNAARLERQMTARGNMNRATIATALALLLAGTAPARAEDGYRLWLRADAPAG
ncbi:putative membrane protein, partial [Sphingomonas sp. BK580]|nr:putative membrane protein [Sphingomonas sp. BK580]